MITETQIWQQTFTFAWGFIFGAAVIAALWLRWFEKRKQDINKYHKRK